MRKIGTALLAGAAMLAPAMPAAAAAGGRHDRRQHPCADRQCRTGRWRRRDAGAGARRRLSQQPAARAQRAALRAVDEQVIQAASPYRLNAGINGTFAYDQQRQRDFFGDFQQLEGRRMGSRSARRKSC
ncbi:hypothetical protein AB5I41_17295 [Sphingomonas sp. MMS24-JH45]